MTRGPATTNTSGRTAERRTNGRRRSPWSKKRKRIRRGRGRLGTKKRTCQVAGTLRPLPPPSTPFGFLRRSLPSPCLAPSYPPLAHSCSTTLSVTTAPIGRLLQPRSPRSARFSTASRRVLYKGFIIRSFLPHLYRARLGEIFSICFIRFSPRIFFSSFFFFSSVQTPREFYSTREAT